MTSGIDESFGKYRLRERLALGGMAEVYLATVHGEAGFVKPVVIKRIHPRMSADQTFVQMLIDEARITAQLTHSNICQVLDLGSVDGSYYLAMEYIPGEDVRTIQDLCLRRETRLPIPAAVFIASEVLAGLDYAHRKTSSDGTPLGIVHRDVSPPNILVSYEGEVKVIDFGIAKARSRLVQTEAGVIKGKFRYMSPEQASGAELDARTDIFAAAVVLYEMLLGEPHVQDLSDQAMLRRMRKADFRPLRDYRAEVSSDLEGVVMKALSLAPYDRYATAEDFRAALLQQPDGAFSRTALAELMRGLFDDERRRRRNVSFGGTMVQAAPPAGREPRRVTAPTLDKPDPAAGAAAAGQGVAPEHEVDDATTRWAPQPSARAADERDLELEGTTRRRPLALDRQEGPAPGAGPPQQMTAGVIVGDDDETEARHRLQPPRPVDDDLAGDDDLSDRRTLLPPLPDHDDLSDRRTLAAGDLPGGQAPPPSFPDDLSDRATILPSFPDDLSDRRTLLQSDSGRMTRVRSEVDARPPQDPPPRTERGRHGAAGRFTRGTFEPPHRQHTAPLTALEARVAQPRPSPADAPVAPPPARGETAMTRNPAGPGPAARIAIRVTVVVVLGVGLALGVNWLDSQGLFFRPAEEPDTGAAWRAPDAQATEALTSSWPEGSAAPPAGHGQLRIRSTPGGAQILLCGRPTGKRTPAALNVAVAAQGCTLELVLAGHETYQIPVTAREGQTINIVATLRRTPDPAPPERPSDPER